MLVEDFSGDPVVKNSPCNAGDVGPIPCQRIKIPHAKEQLSPPASTRVRPPKWKIMHDATKIPLAATKTQHSQIN